MQTLDSLRGISALLVVLHHANYLLMPDWGPVAMWFQDWTPLRVVKDGRPPVVFFFVLSGYVLSLALLRQHGPVDLLAWATRRTVRLLLPVAASVLLPVGLYWLFRDAGALPDSGDLVAASWQQSPDLADIARHVLLLGTQDQYHLNIVLWSLIHEWRLSLLAPLLLLFRGQAALLLELAFLLRAAAISAGTAEDEVMVGTQLHSTLVATAYFVFAFAGGAVLALKEPLPSLTGSVRWAAWAAVLAATVSRSDLAVVAASMLLILLVRDGTGVLASLLRTPPLQWLGQVSYSLYLVHVPVSLALSHGMEGEWSPVAMAALSVLLSLPTAALFYAVVERPSIALSRHIGR